MIWHKKQFQPFETVARTGFLTSLSSYIIFWLLDVVRPGFVSRYFSVHTFLLAAILFGIWWSWIVEEYIERHWIQALFAAVSGILLAVLIWGPSKDLEGYRILLVLVAFFTPTIILEVLKKS